MDSWTSTWLGNYHRNDYYPFDTSHASAPYARVTEKTPETPTKNQSPSKRI
jgi:hypothetical protein